jgi:penicillin-binding protein 2
VSNVSDFNISEIDSDLAEDQRVIIGITSEEVNTISTAIEDVADIIVLSRFERVYSYPEQFSHIVGYTGHASTEDVEEGYGPNDTVGKYRIESIYEEHLKGTKGAALKEGLSSVTLPPKQGDSIYLTVDSKWQNELYRLFEDYNGRYNAAGGAGVIMNSDTGDIKAMVSYPGFDSNLLVKGASQGELDSITESYLEPFFDKAVSGAYTPGSIFKIVSAYTLLNTSIINPSSQFFSNQCMSLGGGYEFCEFGQNFYGLLDLEKALYKSSNLYFCNYMLELEDKFDGVNQFIEHAKSLGIGSKTGIIFEDEARGNMDSPIYKNQTTGEAWFSGDTCNAVIGQGAVLVSPIQMTVILAMIANGGDGLKPQVIDRVESQSGSIVEKTDTDVISHLDMSQSDLDAIKKGLNGVAYNPGSSVYWFLKDLPNNVHAKTGSAETFEITNGILQERTHSWISGTFEYGGETYSFTFFQKFGGGGYFITPLLRDFLNSINSL